MSSRSEPVAGAGHGCVPAAAARRQLRAAGAVGSAGLRSRLPARGNHRVVVMDHLGCAFTAGEIRVVPAFDAGGRRFCEFVSGRPFAAGAGGRPSRSPDRGRRRTAFCAFEWVRAERAGRLSFARVGDADYLAHGSAVRLPPAGGAAPWAGP